MRNVGGKFKTAQTAAERAVERSGNVLTGIDGLKSIFATQMFSAIEAALDVLQTEAEEASRLAELAGGDARAAAQALVAAMSTADAVVRYSASDPQLRATVAELNEAVRETKETEEACMLKLMAAQNGAVDAMRAINRAKERCAKEQEKVVRAADRQREEEARHREQDRGEMMEDMKVLTDVRELIKEVTVAARRVRLQQELHQDPERALLAKLQALQQRESVSLLAGRAFGLQEPAASAVAHSMPMRPRPSELDLDLIDREPPATSRSVADSLGSSKNSRLEYKPISELMKIHGVGYKKAEELYKRHNSTVEQGEDAFSRLAGVPHPQSQGLLPERNG